MRRKDWSIRSNFRSTTINTKASLRAVQQFRSFLNSVHLKIVSRLKYWLSGSTLKSQNWSVLKFRCRYAPTTLISWSRKARLLWFSTSNTACTLSRRHQTTTGGSTHLSVMTQRLITLVAQLTGPKTVRYHHQSGFFLAVWMEALVKRLSSNSTQKHKDYQRWIHRSLIEWQRIQWSSCQQRMRKMPKALSTSLEASTLTLLVTIINKTIINTTLRQISGLDFRVGIKIIVDIVLTCFLCVTSSIFWSWAINSHFCSIPRSIGC